MRARLRVVADGNLCLLEAMLPFWLSIGVLSACQGALVAVPRRLVPEALVFARGRRWALIPPLSVVGFVFITRAAEHAKLRSVGRFCGLI